MSLSIESNGSKSLNFIAGNIFFYITFPLCNYANILEQFLTVLISADETPTPTRFIRNCEEVGLFQDLQNVNPEVNPFDGNTKYFS